MQKLFNITNETDHIVKIELANGKKHNPLSLELIKELTNSLIQISLPNGEIYLIDPNQVLGRANKYFLDSCKKIFCYTNDLINFPQSY